MPDAYNFLDAKINYAEVVRDPTDREKTKMVKVLSVTRRPGGRVARLGFTISKPKKRDVELEIDEPTVRAIAKLFDEAPAELPPYEDETV